MTRRSSSRPSKRGARPASGRRAAAAPAPTFLTPARKRELSGAALVALAVVTLVSFVSQGGRLTQWWVGLLETGFGWGRFGLPILLGGIGAWFIVDSMDDRVEQRWSRPVGALGLYLALLGILHLGLSLLRPGIAPRIFKETGVAGGAFGYALGEGLRPVLGAVPAMALLLVLAAVSASFVAGLGLVGGAELLWRGLRQGSTGIWQRRDAAGGLLVGLRERLPGRTFFF
ncbi:MAG: DNA translocase FtsK 4TM domain-containing protein, partial [Chloroflexi bacterium]|nr:DNA translocase FtsK 4TM domain-containing protein [Chloroflexota bacterium]